MFNNLKKKFNNALQEASIISENLHYQYRTRGLTPDTNLNSSRNSLTTSTLDSGLPSDVNVAAGINLLVKYEDDWKAIHRNNLENSEKAKNVAKQIMILDTKMANQQMLISDLKHCLAGIPNLIEKLKTCRETLSDVQSQSQMVQEELDKLEDLCEEYELHEYILEKHCELNNYKQKKNEDLEVYRQNVAAEHQQRIYDHEKKLRKIQRERQEVFDDAFQHDLEEFKQKGHIPKIHANANQDINLEEVVLEDADGKDALEKFLNA